MNHRLTVLLVAIVGFPFAAHAQHGPGAGRPPSTVAPREARQFDFLLGQWQVVAEPKVSKLAAIVHGQPKLTGTWKAWRAFDGFGIQDELRLSDGDGNAVLLSCAMRAYDGGAGHWAGTGLDVYRGQFKPSTAEWKDGGMTVLSHGTEEGREVVWRSRFDAITPRSFHWQQDRSCDGGRTWSEPTLEVEARRAPTPAPR